MFRLLKLIFMILLINDKIFCDETTNLPVDKRINLEDIDTGTLLSGFFDGEIVDGCPGQCIHTITSLFCPNVVENVTCGSPLQKCCDFGNGSFITNSNKVAETVLPVEEITTVTSNYNSNEKHSSTTQNLEKLKNTQSEINLSTTQSPLNSFTNNIVKKYTLKCSGDCIDNQSSKYCANILTNSGLCDNNQICCLKLNNNNLTTASIGTSDNVIIDLKNISTSPIPNISIVQTTTSPTTTTTTLTTLKSTQNQTNLDKKKIIKEDTDETTSSSAPDSENSTVILNKQSHNKNSDETMQPNLPECDNCISLVFSILCDEIDHSRSCPSWAKCCVYYNETYTGPNKTDTSNTDSTTLTGAQSSTANQSPTKCLGTCIPTFLSGICTKPTKIFFNTDCARMKSVCCHTPMPIDDQYNSTSIGYDKPSSLLDYSDSVHYIEPSEQTLNNLNNYNNFNKLSTFKPPNYYQLVPRPNQSPPNLLSGLTSNWPFLNNNNNHQKIPIYKPLLSNSQMIPNPYLPQNTGLNSMRGGNSGPSGHAQILNTLNSLNNLNNLSPSVNGIYYPPSTSNNPTTTTANDLFNTLNMYLSNNHLSNNILPTIPTPLKLNTTTNLINHLILSNKIPQVSCTGTCIPFLLKFTCFGSNNIIYTNFGCAKPQQLCCASTNDVEAYEQFILNNFTNNETSPINNLLHHFTNNNYINNLPVLVGNSNSLPNLNNNLNSNSLSNLLINKPLNNINNLNSVKNNNLNVINKNKNQNFNMNKLRPLINNIQPDNNMQSINPSIEKLTELNQQNIPASSNLNRQRHRYPASNSINNNKNIAQINLNNKWSNSLSNLSSNHFSPSEKPLNHKTILNIDKPKKSASSTIQPTEHFSVEIPSSTSNKLPICGLPGIESSKWCWQVAIVNQDNQFISSGALIGSSWILTTASAISELVRNAKPLFVRVGDLTDLTSSNTFNSDSGQIQKVSTTYIHHNHNGETFENDIALLKLSQPIQLKSNVCLICLPARGSMVQSGKRCIATGYNLESDSSLRIKETSVTILNEYQCSKKINSLTNKGFILPTSSFCTNNEDTNNCQFDEGGPLSCYLEDGYYELTGMVSYNFGCSNDKVPNIYVRVSLFINWINQIISVNN